jgi:hypothetical protein
MRHLALALALIACAPPTPGPPTATGEASPPEPSDRRFIPRRLISDGAPGPGWNSSGGGARKGPARPRTDADREALARAEAKRARKAAKRAGVRR